MTPHIERLFALRSIGMIHAGLIIMSFALPWAFPEDHTRPLSLFSVGVKGIAWSYSNAEIVGAGITLAIGILAMVYFLIRSNNSPARWTATTLFLLIASFPITGAATIENVSYGYAVTLLLAAPTPAFLLINWTTRQLEQRRQSKAEIQST